MPYKYEGEITSVDPLNLALRAKSKTTRLWWWSITVIDFAAMFALMAILIVQFEEKQINAAIKLKRNQFPFPAVTFCNLNPYKKSALTTTPYLPNLLDQFKKASQLSNKKESPRNQSVELNKKRQKRATVCACKGMQNSIIVQASLGESVYALFSNATVSWTCGFECCAKYPPTGLSYASSRLARIDSDAIVAILRDACMITTKRSFCGLCGDGTGAYYWYDNSTFRNGAPVKNASDICSTCQPDDQTAAFIIRDWNAGYKLSIQLGYTNPKNIGFDSSDNKTIHEFPLICEYYPVSPMSSFSYPCRSSTIAPTSQTSTKPSTNSTPSTTLASSTQSAKTTSEALSSVAISSTTASTTVIIPTSSQNQSDTSIAPAETTPVTILTSSQTQSDISITPDETTFISSANTMESTGFTESEIFTTKPSIAPAKTSLTASANTYTSTMQSTGSTESEVFTTELNAASDTTTNGLTQAIVSTTQESTIDIFSSPVGTTTAVTNTAPISEAPLASSSTLHASTIAQTTAASTLQTIAFTQTSTVSASTKFVSTSDQSTVFSSAPLRTTPYVSSSFASPLSTIAPPQLTSISNQNNAITNSSIDASLKTIFDPVKQDANALSATAEDVLSYLIPLIPRDVLIQAGFNISEAILRCVYNGARCSLNDFTLQFDASFGNCYTFNMFGNFMVGARDGALTGLSVTYNVGGKEYLEYPQMAGVRVVVHKQNETVFPDVMGFNVANGYQSSTAMRMVQTKKERMSSNFCAFSPKDVPTYNYNNTYTTEACIRSCYQQLVIDKCQCGDPRVPLPLNTKVDFCDLKKRNCVFKIYDANIDNNCGCPPACQVVDYEITQSMMKWPPNFEKDIKWGELDGTASSSDVTELARIDVYYETLDVIEYVENAFYSWDKLIWDLSSIVGLALGISVISLFEVIKLGKWCSKK